MTRPDLTDITIVLDRSGSMESVREATIAAFNDFVRSQRGGDGEARLSLVQFDDQYETPYTDQPVDAAPLLTAGTYEPRGSTALLDAIGTTIDRTGARLSALPEERRPGSVVVAILTDGFENASHRFDMAAISAKIAHQRTIYAWQFLFLAANQDAIATAAGLGVGAAQSLTFAASPTGVHAAAASLGRQMRSARDRRVAQAREAGPAGAPPAAPLDVAFDATDRAESLPTDPPAASGGAASLNGKAKRKP